MWVRQSALSALDRQFCEVISLTSLGRFTQTYEWCGNGCPPCPRVWLAHAFIAKSVYQFPTTSALLDALRSRPLLRQLCGWDSPGEIPSEPTFSRAFKQFADDCLPQQIHEHLVKTHAGPTLVGHVSRDATAIEAPERPAPKPAPAAKAPCKRGRPKRGEVRAPAPLKRVELQPARTLAENLADLPTRLRRGGQAQQQRASGKLDRLQTASRHRGWGLPGQRGADQRQRA